MTEADKERLAKLIEDRVAGVEAYVEQSRAMGLNADMVPRHQGVIEGYRNAARLVREQPAEPAWIAVEDRLPEDAVNVLVVDEYGDRTIAYYTLTDGRLYSLYGSVAEREKPGQWHRADDLAGEPTHWMPLPPPPA
jgi:hypothetical protein